MRSLIAVVGGAGLLVTAGCALGNSQAAPQVTPWIPATSDRQTPGGQVTRTCGSHYAEEFDPGIESRTITAGPVSMVASRVSPVPRGTSPARNFKLMVRLEAGAVATLHTLTPGTSLAYDRTTFNRDNMYRLSDGDQTVGFVGCSDRPAVFNGAVLTEGPRTVELEVTAGGAVQRRMVSAFAG